MLRVVVALGFSIGLAHVRQRARLAFARALCPIVLARILLSLSSLDGG